jgi:hypothetical protein
LGFLPIANWLPGGETDRVYASRFIEWGYGTAICLGVAVIAVVLLRGRMRREDAPLTADGRGSARGSFPVHLAESGVPVFSWLIPFVALALYEERLFRPATID